MNRPIPARIADTLSQPVNARQYFFVFAACFAAYYRLFAVILVYSAPHLQQHLRPATPVSFALLLFAVAGISTVTTWLMEHLGPPVLRYAIRRL